MQALILLKKTFLSCKYLSRHLKPRRIFHLCVVDYKLYRAQMLILGCFVQKNFTTRQILYRALTKQYPSFCQKRYEQKAKVVDLSPSIQVVITEQEN